VFERFTDRARHVVVLAQEEARRLDHGHIGTEHLLLGLIREGEGVAAQALAAIDISLDEARRSVEEMIGRGTAAPVAHIPFTPRAKKVLELSLREARHFGHNYIGTEHILLGLIREGEGVAAQALKRLGADLSRVRQSVIRVLEEHPSGTELRIGARPIPARAVRLLAMTKDEFDEWMGWAVGVYARDEAEAHATRIEIERTRAEIAALLPDGQATDGHRFRVAVDAETGERVGQLWFAQRRTEAGDVCWLYDLYVHEAMRGRGYGRGMLRALEDEIRELGLSRIELNVYGFNARARRLYESLGFVEMARQLYKVLPET
jgi:ribosomal protein S18 acetylase RimI-like enzyme